MSRAEKAPYRDPNVDCLGQVDFPRLSGDPKTDPGTNIHKYGCRFMCELAICQYVSKKKLSQKDIYKIYNKAVNGELGGDVMTQNCIVGVNEDKLMSYALELLGNDKVVIRQHRVKGINSQGDWNINNWQPSDLPGKGNAYFCIVDFNTYSNSDYGGHHFVLFNGIGEFIYDPSKGQVNSYKNVNRLLFYKVFQKK